MAFVRLLVALAALTLVCAGADAQQTGRRVALVIGNGAYASQGTLANPGPDSRLIADALRRVGFAVTAQTDLGKAAMDQALRDFSRQADGAEVALVYYAGHGMEANGINWLVPVDATLADERDLSFEAVSLDTVLATVDRARGLRMVVLDACRNNPFTRSMRRGTSSTRAVTRGLADVEVTGTLVLYAARGGSLAQDGPAGANSPFATALARRIPEPGVDIRLLVSKVRDDVLTATGRTQEPFSYGSLPGVELALVAGNARVQRPSPTAPVEDAETLAWRAALNAGSADAFREYLRLYPRGRFATLAQQNIDAVEPAPARPSAPSVGASEWMGTVEWYSGLAPTTSTTWRLKADGTFSSSGGNSYTGRWTQSGASLRLVYDGDDGIAYVGLVDGASYTGAVQRRGQNIGAFRLQRIG